ncbi:hypothetical protein OIU85_018452 [Salix viminalis]|uniref:Peptidase S26 domain-containing protein n=1 Tax=Salix viminalis TaxID=40686 RepID=A0A9Q0UUB1_SALVM|nr:hypothetical protein OIU85_018452 [Salix viminalis]
MVSVSTWFRYIANKLDYSVSLSYKSYKGGLINDKEVIDSVWKNLFQGKLTFLHWTKGQEMAPTIGDQGGTLLVRKLPAADPMRVFVGDVVLLKDPEKSDNFLVRRLAAIEGYEMASTDEKDEPFVLDKDECWVLADNEKLKAKEANDSRNFEQSFQHEKGHSSAGVPTNILNHLVWQSDNRVFLCNQKAGCRLFSIWSFNFIWLLVLGFLSCLSGCLWWDSCHAFIATYDVL